MKQLIEVTLALLGCLGLAKALDSVTVTEDEDNVGYFLGEAQDTLPRCPDTIPEWMMEEHSGTPR